MAQRIRIIIAFLLFFVPSAQAGLVETYFNYDPTSTVTNTNLNGNFDNIRNVLNGGINGDNISTANGWRLIEILSSPPSAGNQGRVVFLTSNNTLNFDTGATFITTAVLPNNQTFGGSNTFNGSTNFVGDITGTTNFTGTTNLKGATNTIGDGGSDTLTLNLGSGMSSSAMTWTLTGALTFSGTIADLGTVTTANIDGGTMDGVQIGGTTATGELIVNDASDDADGLGSQGTSGQVLRSAGTGANPTWGDGFIKLSTTTFDAATTLQNVTITADKKYFVVITITDASVDLFLYLRFNSDSAGNYTWYNDELTFPTTKAATGSSGDSEIEFGDLDGPSTEVLKCNVFFDAEDTSADIHVFGKCGGMEAGAGGLVLRTVEGVYRNGATLTTMGLISSTGSISGSIEVYESN